MSVQLIIFLQDMPNPLYSRLMLGNSCVPLFLLCDLCFFLAMRKLDSIRREDNYGTIGFSARRTEVNLSVMLWSIIEAEYIA